MVGVREQVVDFWPGFCGAHDDVLADVPCQQRRVQERQCGCRVRGQPEHYDVCTTELAVPSAGAARAPCFARTAADLGRPLPILVDERIPQRYLPAETCSGVGLDVLHNDDDLPVRTLRDRVPDGQTVGREMETVPTRQRVYFGERVGKCRNWFFEQVKDCPMGSVSKRLRQLFDFIPGSVREAKNPVTH
jgi:hypothetical protein